MLATAHTRVIPLAIPAGFVFLGEGFSLVAGFLLALPFSPIWAALWFALGFVGLVVTGMLYKILPFLVWTHRYAPRAGREKVPLLKEMLPEGAGYGAGALLALGALLFPFFPWAGWIYLAGALPHVYALWEVMRR